MNKRIKLVDLIREAHENGSRLDKACEVAVLSKRTYRRWYKAGKVQADLRATAVRPACNSSKTCACKQANRRRTSASVNDV